MRIQIQIAEAKSIGTQLYTGNSGCYSCVRPDDTSKRAIVNLCERFGLHTDPEELHCTLVYSREKAIPMGLIPVTTGRQFDAICTEVKCFQGHDDAWYVALGLDSEDLAAENKRLIESGAKHSFDDYMPHVTLARVEEMTDDLKRQVEEMNGWLAQPLRLVFVDQTFYDISSK